MDASKAHEALAVVRAKAGAALMRFPFLANRHELVRKRFSRWSRATRMLKMRRQCVKQIVKRWTLKDTRRAWSTWLRIHITAFAEPKTLQRAGLLSQLDKTSESAHALQQTSHEEDDFGLVQVESEPTEGNAMSESANAVELMSHEESNVEVAAAPVEWGEGAVDEAVEGNMASESADAVELMSHEESNVEVSTAPVEWGEGAVDEADQGTVSNAVDDDQWVELVDEAGEVYYWHKGTNQTSWTLPQNAEHVPTSVPANSESSDFDASTRPEQADTAEVAESSVGQDVEGEESSLPPGWSVYVDDTSGYAYYCNAETGETSWDLPG